MKTLVFDFGNVIAHFDHRITVAKLLPFTTLSADDLFRAIYHGQPEIDYECGRLSTEEFFHTVLPESKLTCPLPQFVAAFEDIFTPNQEVCELIPFLRPGCRLLLASNTNAAHFDRFTAQFGKTLSYFNLLLPSFRVGQRKPSAEYFEFCQVYAEAAPGECLFIDDLPENVDAARRHGWNGLVYTPPMDLREELLGLGIRFREPLR